ncbi:hypothetical protein [Methylobacterium nigriterrae]|uniref:hypothetical protein n=1 Tax=Methylobacterium nigriterrae TaxID=3127512 RepID=UPI003013C318
MQKPSAHPFSITLRANQCPRGTFSWTVRQRGAIGRKQSLTPYATFEEARLAGKAVLDEMVESWRREALHTAAA